MKKPVIAAADDAQSGGSLSNSVLRDGQCVAGYDVGSVILTAVTASGGSVKAGEWQGRVWCSLGGDGMCGSRAVCASSEECVDWGPVRFHCSLAVWRERGPCQRCALKRFRAMAE